MSTPAFMTNRGTPPSLGAEAEAAGRVLAAPLVESFARFYDALGSVVSTEQMGLDGPGLSSRAGPEAERQEGGFLVILSSSVSFSLTNMEPLLKQKTKNIPGWCRQGQGGEAHSCRVRCPLHAEGLGAGDDPRALGLSLCGVSRKLPMSVTPDSSI